MGSHLNKPAFTNGIGCWRGHTLASMSDFCHVVFSRGTRDIILSTLTNLPGTRTAQRWKRSSAVERGRDRHRSSLLSRAVTSLCAYISREVPTRLFCSYYIYGCSHVDSVPPFVRSDVLFWSSCRGARCRTLFEMPGSKSRGEKLALSDKPENMRVLVED